MFCEFARLLALYLRRERDKEEERGRKNKKNNI